ncbi:hypothetical protein FM107_20560 [Sphingobacterium sp. JB170]|nr:hypothetical protein FM107_20560 [Sphingobacterium sp. JB170]
MFPNPYFALNYFFKRFSSQCLFCSLALYRKQGTGLNEPIKQ